MGYVGDTSEVGTGGRTSSGEGSSNVITPYSPGEGKNGWPGVELVRIDASVPSNNIDDVDKDKPISPLDRPF
jgi:hypothetical protein